MTPSNQCKAAGLDSLAELVRIVPIPRSTLLHMPIRNPELFEFIVFAAAAKKKQLEEVK